MSLYHKLHTFFVDTSFDAELFKQVVKSLLCRDIELFADLFGNLPSL